MAATSLSTWLSLCKEVLTVSVDAATEGSGGDERDEDDDNAEFTHGEDSSAVAMVQPRWGTRVFAAVCLRKIIQECCEGDRAHFDLCLAKEVTLAGGRDEEPYLVLHLSNLVRMCFMAATSDADPLRLEGLRTMQVVIDRFAETTEPEFPGHVILEQYQAQVGAALRPAFAPDTASHVTATACAVCSTWISSGVARELSDLRRVYQLLVSSLSKLKKGFSSGCYNESSSTLEKLSILKAWAEVYIVSMASTSSATSTPSDDEDFGDFEGEGKEEEDGKATEASNLTGLVASELASLSKHWLAALKDHALLSLSNEFKSQLPYEGGAFYTMDTIELAKPHYKSTWAAILAAAATWLSQGGGFDNVSMEKTELDVTGSANIGLGPANATSSADPEEINRSRFHLLLGVSMEALCSPRTGDLSLSHLSACLAGLSSLLDHQWTREQLAAQPGLLVELCNVMHRQLLSQDDTSIQATVLTIISLALTAAKENLASRKKQKLKELFPANQAITDIPAEVAELGEGGQQDGELRPGLSVSFAVLEVCVCVLVRYFPDISPRAAQSSSVIAMQARSRVRSKHGSGLSSDQQALISATVSVLSQVPGLCSPQGSNTVIPTVLYLLTGVLKNSARSSSLDSQTLYESSPIQSCLTALQKLVSVRYPTHPEEEAKYLLVVESGLLTVLDFAKTAPQQSKLDQISLLLVIKVYLIYTSEEMLSRPNILYPAINAFSSSLQSPEHQVQTNCLRILSDILRHGSRGMSLNFLQTTGPLVVRWCLDQQINHPSSEAQLGLVLECLAFLESMMEVAEPEKRSQLLKIHIPILIKFLRDEKLGVNTNQFESKLHEVSLSKLTSLGGQFKAEFKQLLAANAEMKRRVEEAVRAEMRAVDSLAAQSCPAQPSQPSIKLKMDFSNFK